MRTLINGIGIFRALLPVVYCAGLVIYFGRFGGWSADTLNSIGLGPTVLGLAVIGLLFCIPLILKIRRAVAGSKPARSRPSEDAEPEAGEESGFDADAALARYLARKEQGLIKPVAAGTGPRPAFGRKGV